jgi:putative pyruvate formate lyase activating enzyme
MESWRDELKHCSICPRGCGVDRTAGQLGYCRTGADFRIGSLCLHRGEEPALGGTKGICNLFFAHCNLQCTYCQNHQISRNRGTQIAERLELPVLIDRIAEILAGGVRHLGFVSPSHCIPQMKAIIAGVRARGLRPVTVMNTNAYDRPETLRSLAELIDVYLPDLKYQDGALAAGWSGAEDYPVVATAALREMHRQKGSYLFCDASGDAEAGLIVRHLVLPGQVADSKRCLQFIAEELSPSVHVSLLAQYAPPPDVAADPLLGRSVTAEEYAEVVAELHRLGFRHGWVQELTSPGNYVPDFRRAHPFEPSRRPSFPTTPSRCPLLCRERSMG